MLSLVWKDVEAARRPLLLVIVLGVFQLASFATFGPVFLPAALVFSGLLAFIPIPVEEVQGTEILWNSLPVTRGQIVGARYLSVLAGILAGLGTSWVVGQTVTRLVPSGASGTAPFVGLGAHALLFSFLALASALFLPLYFGFGAGRGMIVFSAVAVGALLFLPVLGQVVLFMKGYSSPVLDPGTWKEVGPEIREKIAAWLAPRIGRILVLLAGFSALAMAFSALVSRRLYEARDL
jgi:hypothetical protein